MTSHPLPGQRHPGTLPSPWRWLQVACVGSPWAPPSGRQAERRVERFPEPQADPWAAPRVERRLQRRGDPGPDTPPAPRSPAAAPDIAAEDWDLLFRAVLAFLARVALEQRAPAGRLLAPPGAALRECLAALDQLRRSRP